jgi:AhpD family alkylhydroperoxidase
VSLVYRRIEADFGMLVPPVALHAPAPDVLAACWSVLRETTLAAGPVCRADRERVAAAVSAANRCPYCVEIHGGTLAGLLGDSSGLTTATAFAAPAQAASSAEARAVLGGVALTFEYLNRMVNVFLKDSPLPLLSERGRDRARRVAARVLARLAVDVPPGASLDLLPPASGAAVPDWAAGQPHIASALARAGAVFSAAGARSVPPAVRQLVSSRLGAGAPALLDGGWFAEQTGELPEADRAAGRLALLTAVASYRVTDRDVASARTAGLDDAGLIDLAAWSSWTAALQAAT